MKQPPRRERVHTMLGSVDHAEVSVAGGHCALNERDPLMLILFA